MTTTERDEWITKKQAQGAAEAIAKAAKEMGFMKAVEMLRGKEAAFQGRTSFESRGHLASWWADWLLEQREEEK